MSGRRFLFLRLQSLHALLMILVTLGYLLATHLSTINSLKAAIAGKAERAEVEQMDRKLTRIEVKLEEAVLGKAEFDRLREHFDRTVVEIKYKLSTEEGVNNQHGR